MCLIWLNSRNGLTKTEFRSHTYIVTIEKEVEQGKVGYFRSDSQANRVYYPHGKAIALCGDSGGGGKDGAVLARMYHGAG